MGFHFYQKGINCVECMGDTFKIIILFTFYFFPNILL